MRRILVLLTVALMMAAMMTFGAGAASAQAEFVQAPCINSHPDKLFGSVIITPHKGATACVGQPV